LVDTGANPAGTPTTKDILVDGTRGSIEIRYPDFLPPPTVARASSFTRTGPRSRTVSVLIKRDSDLPADPPPPPPPITAPAGTPVTCASKATTVGDPTGDVLTYQPGTPPHTPEPQSRELAGIDIVRATVRIDGSTVCATISFAPAAHHRLRRHPGRARHTH